MPRGVYTVEFPITKESETPLHAFSIVPLPLREPFMQDKEIKIKYGVSSKKLSVPKLSPPSLMSSMYGYE